MGRAGVWLLALATAVHGAPVRLADLPGHETEAAWSPDGTRIVFQWERDGDRDLAILDLASGQVRPLVAGPGQACYPAWTPDSQAVVYSYGRFTTTALEATAGGVAEGFNLWRIAVAGGEPTQLTRGRVRDYLPRVGAAADTLWFTSTRGLKHNSAGLFRLALGGPAAEPVPVVAVDHESGGAVQPEPSPDGRLLAYACCDGIRSNWHLRLRRVDVPQREADLTSDEWVAYAPRGSPDGALIACTGYRPGDPGWGVYLVQTRTGRDRRLDTGAGNWRSPAWSPNGKELVFEGDAAGSYDLYRMAVPADLTFAAEPDEALVTPAPVIRFRFDQPVTGRATDASGTGNDGLVLGSVPWADGALRFGDGSLQVKAPKGCDFGAGPFYVTVRLRVDRHTDALRLIVVGDYPESRLGWQVFLNDQNRLYVNSRSPSGAFVGACTPEALPVGRTLEATGMRDARGRVRLYLDDALVAEAGGATLAYGVPNQVRVGCQFDGAARFGGRVYAVEVGRGAPACSLTREQKLEEVFR